MAPEIKSAVAIIVGSETDEPHDVCWRCGVVDLHLEDGLCDGCLPLAIDNGCDGDGIPLGADAGVYLGHLQPIAGDIPPLCDEP